MTQLSTPQPAALTIDDLRKQHEADRIGALVYSVFNSDNGKELFKVLEDMWFAKPMKMRLQMKAPQLTEGELAYQIGQQDALNRLKLAYDQYEYISQALARTGDLK